MIEYLLERNVYNKNIMGLYRNYFPEKFEYMKKLQILGKIEFFVIASDGDRIVSAMGIKKEKKLYRYLHIVTHPEYQRRGIGTKMHEKAFEFCKKEGAEIVDLMKEKDDYFNNKKFEKLGFQHEASRMINGVEWYYYKWNRPRKRGS